MSPAERALAKVPAPMSVGYWPRPGSLAAAVLCVLHKRHPAARSAEEVRGLLGRVSWAPVVSSNRRLLTTIRMLCDAGLLDVAEKVAAHGAGPKWRKTWRWRKPDEQHG